MSVIKHIAKTTSEPTTTIASDQFNMPKILPNGVPIYESIYAAGILRMIKSLEVLYIPMAIFMSSMPYLMLSAIALHWGVYYKVSNILCSRMLCIC